MGVTDEWLWRLCWQTGSCRLSPFCGGPACYIDYSSFVLLVTGSSTIASVAMASLASSSSSSPLFSSPLSLGQGIVYSLYRPRWPWTSNFPASAFWVLVYRHTPSFLVNVVLCVLDAEQLSYNPSPTTSFTTVILYLLVDTETTCWF